jgi:hypothetical protein
MLRPSTLSARTQQASDFASDFTKTKTPPPMPFDPPLPVSNTTTQRTTARWFQITVDHSRAVHQDYVERQPFWKQFNPTKSLAQEDLAKKVPHYGLSDVSKRPPNAHRTPRKVLQQMSEYVERSMPSLRGMAENSENEKHFLARRGIAENSENEHWPS